MHTAVRAAAAAATEPPVVPPAEWGVRFQALAAQAGEISARSLRRYQDLLGRVARGELQPDQVQTQFQEYLQSQATASTREMVELSVGLLAGLLYVEARYREALLDGLLPPDAPIPPPPSPSGVDLPAWFQALSTYAGEQSARAVARHQMLVERVSAGQIPAARVQEHGRRYLETHAPAFLGEVMDLGLAFVGRLQQSSSSFTEGLYDRVLGPDDARPAEPEPPVCVDLRAPEGSVASAVIVVENSRAEAAEVVCRTSEFAARAFGRRVRAALVVEPARFTLAPGEQREVHLQLTLDPSLFAPGADYVASLQIAGAGDRELIVQLLAHAEALPSEASSPELSDATGPPAADEPPLRRKGPGRPGARRRVVTPPARRDVRAHARRVEHPHESSTCWKPPDPEFKREAERPPGQYDGRHAEGHGESVTAERRAVTAERRAVTASSRRSHDAPSRSSPARRIHPRARADCLLGRPGERGPGAAATRATGPGSRRRGDPAPVRR
jgi:hypothetical protein